MQILIVLFLLIFTNAMTYIFAKKKPKVVGEIILDREQSLFVELNNEKTLDYIKQSDYVTFSVNKRNSHN